MRALTAINILVFWLSIALIIKYDSLAFLLVFVGFLLLELVGLSIYGQLLDRKDDFTSNKKPRS